MPMLDVTLPANTLGNEQKRELMRRLTETLLQWENIPLDSPFVPFAWAYIHEMPDHTYARGGVTAGGVPPHYRVVVTTPQGALTAEGKAGLIADVTRTILAVEGVEWNDRDRYRVTCYVLEVPDHGYGVGGDVFKRAERS